MLHLDYPKAVWTPGPNFDSGRDGTSIDTICIHGSASPNQDINWWADRASTRGGVQYMVGRQPYMISGTRTQIIQMVRESDTSWGNGAIDKGCMPQYKNPNPNKRSISIEFIKFMADNSDRITASQQQTGFDLILSLCKKYRIPAHFPGADGAGITMHMLIHPIGRDFCPGPFPFGELFTYLHRNGIPGAY
jgi:hypothetical protein